MSDLKSSTINLELTLEEASYLRGLLKSSTTSKASTIVTVKLQDAILDSTVFAVVEESKKV